MSEYVHRIPTTPLSGYASDPDQTVSNAGGIGLDTQLTIKNSIALGATASYAKRTASAVGGALINQQGNARVERNLNIAKSGFGFVALGVATGGLAIPAIALATEVGIGLIQQAETNQEIRFENERKVSERGGLTSLGSSYD